MFNKILFNRTPFNKYSFVIELVFTEDQISRLECYFINNVPLYGSSILNIENIGSFIVSGDFGATVDNIENADGVVSVDVGANSEFESDFSFSGKFDYLADTPIDLGEANGLIETIVEQLGSVMSDDFFLGQTKYEEYLIGHFSVPEGGI